MRSDFNAYKEERDRKEKRTIRRGCRGEYLSADYADERRLKNQKEWFLNLRSSA
jgi:hypothetical protein